MKRVPWPLIAGLVVIGLGFALFLLFDQDDPSRQVILVGIGVLALAMVGYLLVRIAAFASGLWSAAPWIPIVAGAAIIASLFVLPADDPRSRLIAVTVGLTISLLVWALTAVLVSQRSTPARSNSRAFAQVQERIRELRVRVNALEAANKMLPLDGLAQAKAQLDAINARLMPSEEVDVAWSTGAGYQDVWTGIHRAEEWLIGEASANELRVGVLHDSLRISNSPLDRLLRQELADVLKELDECTDKSGGPCADGVPPTHVITRLRLIRRSINEFRDGRWDGLVRATAQLERSTLITAWTAFAMLTLVLGLGASRETIAAGAVFFIVGALIGLMAQLRSDARREEAVEDYGLSKARLYQTVLASGIAAVAGVVLMAIAIDTSGTTDSANRLQLADIFDVGGSPGQLLIAAVFGLSPQLLIDRLATTAEKYKSQLSATEVGSSAPPASSSGLPAS